MKQKFFIFLTIFVLAFFVGFLFLFGEYVIQGEKANNFVSFAFANNQNHIDLSTDNYTALEVNVFANKTDLKKVKVSFSIDEKIIDAAEFSITPKSFHILPTETVTREIQKLDKQNFEYRLDFSWEEKKSDSLLKKLTIE